MRDAPLLALWLFAISSFADARAQAPLPDAAATRAQLWALCINADHAQPPLSAANACTQIIQSGRETAFNTGIAYFNRGNAETVAGDNSAAAADYTQAIAQGFQHADVYYGRANARNALRQYDDALSDYDAAIRANPNHADAINNRGNVYQYGLHDYERAIADYTAAIGIRDDALFHANRGNAYQYGLQDISSALADYNRAIELAPDNPDTRIDRGNGYFAQSNYDQALSDYDEALRLRPDYALAYFNIGNALNALSRKREAIEEWTEALRVNPEYAEALGNRARAYYELQQFDRAMADYNAALAIRAEASDYGGRGLVYERNGDLEHALADYDRALQIAPTDPEANNNACWARARAGRDLDAARAQCDAAIAASDQPQYFLSRGLLGLRQQRYQDAWLDYDAAARRAPSSAPALYGRGLAELRLGRTIEGQTDIAAATALDAGVAAQFQGWGQTP
jgi:tetratricopeptide (TPR) repeat protein